MTASTKRSTDQMHAIDIRKLHRKGLLTPGGSFTWQWTRGGNVIATIGGMVDTTDSVTLHYRTRRHGGEWQDKQYQVMIDWTACNYGGSRPWWNCPCCGRRVAVLWGDSTYACRHCQQINYESTRTTPESQAFARAGKVRKQLGWCAGIANPPGGRPKGMHQQTYERLLHHYYELANQAFGASSEAMDKVMGRLRGIAVKPN